MDQKEVMESSAYKILNFLIKEKTEELISQMKSLGQLINQAENPTYWSSTQRVAIPYKPTLNNGISFDKVQEVEIPFEIRSLKSVLDIINNIFRLEKEIAEFNRHRLYLLQADQDWDDGGRRSKAIFGVKIIDKE